MNREQVLKIRKELAELLRQRRVIRNTLVSGSILEFSYVEDKDFPSTENLIFEELLYEKYEKLLLIDLEKIIDNIFEVSEKLVDILE